MKKILVIDNYDSFVFNIVHLLREAPEAPQFDIVHNDCIDFSKLEEYGGLLLSPGPGVPSEAGELNSLIKKCVYSHSMLGICLGHQAIAEVFGAGLLNMPFPLHGHHSVLTQVGEGDPLLYGMEGQVVVGRYHSWVVNSEDFPQDLQVTSVDEAGNIMSLKHRQLPIFGVQYHPESYMSNCGKCLISNWLNTVI